MAIESVRNLVTQERPETSVLGIALTATSLVLMPALGIAKKRLGARLGSGATAGEGEQNLLCAYMAGAVLIGLAANSLWGLWWVDPVIGLGVAAMAVREGRTAWRGENCCAPLALASDDACGCGPGCSDDCCAHETQTLGDSGADRLARHAM